MPKRSYGTVARSRALNLLLALLDYGNDELLADEAKLERLRSQMSLHWEGDRQLIVRTKIRNLETLTEFAETPLSGAQIKTALYQLEHHLQILEDNRTSRRGSDMWHLTLTLWCHRRDRQALAERFEREWEARRRFDGDRSMAPVSLPASAISTDSDPWQDRCRQALDAAANTSLSSNPLTGTAGLHFNLTDVHLPLTLIERTAETESADRLPTPTLLEYALRHDLRQFAIVGEPGAGKTTLLQHLAQEILRHTDALVVFVPLATLVNPSIEAYLFDDWLKLALGKRSVPAEMQTELADRVEQGRVWLLLDAIDELAVASPLSAIAQQLQGWLGQARIVLTCRINLWDAGKNSLGHLQTYALQAYNGYRQIEPFIHQWFTATPDRGEALCRQLALPEYKRLRHNLRNPLRLALFCRLGSYGTLPNSQHQLYQQVVAALYDWQQDYCPTTLLEQHQINRMLGQLAIASLQHTGLSLAVVTQTLAAADLPWFERAVELGWLTPIATRTGEKLYRFLHSTFRDYFAAQAIADGRWFTTGEMAMTRSHWEPVMLLWLGRDDLDTDTKYRLISDLVAFEDGCGGFFEGRAWLLAARSLRECPDHPAAQRIVDRLMAWRLNRDRATSPILIEGARLALAQSDVVRVRAALEDVARDPQWDGFDRWMAAYSLGRSYDEGSCVAIATLEELLPTLHRVGLKMDMARHLGILSPNHPLAIKTLEQIIHTSRRAINRRKAAVRLAKIAPDHDLPIATLQEFLAQNPGDSQTRELLAELRGDVRLPEVTTQTQSRRRRTRTSNPQLDMATRIERTIRAMQQATKLQQRIHLAARLGQLCPGHPQAIAMLWHAIGATDEKATLKAASEALLNCIENEQIPPLVTAIKKRQNEELSLNRTLVQFRLLWSWSGQVGYATFREAWRSS